MSRQMRRTGIPGWYEFYRVACPICNRVGGCIQHKDGDKVACIRIESKTPFSQNSSLPSYLHFLTEDNRRDKINNGEVYEGEEKKSDTELDVVYRALLENIDLSQEHYEHLTSKQRGLKDSQVMVRDYRSFPNKPWQVAKTLSEQLGMNNFSGYPGFYLAEGKYGEYWNLTGMGGILIPFRNVRNEISGFQYRVDNPPNISVIKEFLTGLDARVIKQPNFVQITFKGEVVCETKLELNKETSVYKDGTTSGSTDDLLGWVTLKRGNRYFWLSSANRHKGTGCGNPSPIHISIPSNKLQKWKRGDLLRTKKVWISEGPIKTDIASDYIHKVFEPEEIEALGDTFIALPGVNAWQLALPVLEDMGVEEINLCLDADVVSNIQVQRVLYDCLEVLKEKGYHVNMVIWNENDGKGIDDLFINHKIPHFKSLF